MKSLILLSAGLDSLVCLGLKKEELNITLAITFDYGQKASKKEIEASSKICKYYDIEHKVITLEWLKSITTTSLVGEGKIPSGNSLKNTISSMKSVWVPNRNGLFLNIAGCFADSFGYDNILIGANSEEAQSFIDNTQEFIDSVNDEFKYSTQVKPKVIAPLINCDKNDIVKMAIEHDIPLELVSSCYSSVDGHCGECESCVRLKNALINNNDIRYYNQIFG